MQEQYDILLARYFDGSATPADLQALEQWLAQHPGHEQHFEQLSLLYEQIGLAQHRTAIPPIDTQAAKARFVQYMAQHHATQPVPKHASLARGAWRQWVAVAAGLALLVGIGAMYLWRSNSTSATTILSSLDTPTTHTLLDMTEVRLEAHSSISYGKGYNQGQRSLVLTGKATFAVGQAGQGALVVQAGETFIRDIGTVFTVVAYPDSSWVRIEVQEGEVLFYTPSHAGITLKAGEAGVYHKQQRQFVKHTPLPSSLPTCEVPLVFDGTPLHQVLSRLHSLYGVDIRVEKDSLGLQQINVSFAGEGLEVMLEVIAETLALDLSKEGQTYMLRSPQHATRP